jgi:biotin transport system substrate-specific component
LNPNAATLRLALVPRTGLLTDALLVLGGAAFVAIAAQISIPLSFTPVPITGQTFAVLLVGGALGARLGVLSLMLYWLAGIAGAPVYADQQSGWETFMGPTGGYLIGFVIAAGVTGLLAQRRWDRRFSSSVTAMLTASVIIYACGLPWLAAEIDTGLEATLEAGLYPFVIGDVIKLYLAGALLPAAWTAIRRFRGDQ